MTAVADRAVVLDGATVPSRAVVGNKGRSIAWMLSLGLPVPPALCLPIEECRRFHANGGELEAESWRSVLAGIAGLEEKLGRTFGGGERPLLVSVRSGAAVSSSPNKAWRSTSAARIVSNRLTGGAGCSCATTATRAG